MKDIFERRLKVLTEMQAARTRLAETLIRMGGLAKSMDEGFLIDTLELHVQEFGWMIDELAAEKESSAEKLRWKGKLRDLAEIAEMIINNGWIEARNDTEA